VRLAAPVAVTANVTGPEIFKRVARNTFNCDISYCVGNSTHIEIVLYDTTDVAVPYFSDINT
jgi:hypothetical protein